MVVVSPPILPDKNWFDLLWTDIVDNWRTIPNEAIIIMSVQKYSTLMYMRTQVQFSRLLGPSGSGRSTVRPATLVIA